MAGVRVLLGAGAGLAVATVAIGLLHTPAGRPLLRMLTGQCPVGFGADLTVEERDAAHATAMSAVRGTERAPTRPALGFSLDVTTRAEVDAWVIAHALTCTEKGQTRTCPGVPAGTFGDRPEGEVAFQLDGHDRLVAVTWEVTGLPAADAMAGVAAAEAELTAALGAPGKVSGESDPVWITGGRLRQRSAEWRFTDYRAQAQVTHFDQGRVKVREIYQSIPDQG